jgi:hypothetical protein
MDAELTDLPEMSDRELNEALKEHAIEEQDELSIKDRRLARIDEYEEAALSSSDAFAALIGIGNAHLQRIFEHLSTAILEELESRGGSFEAICELNPHMRLLVKMRSSVEKVFAVQPPNDGQQFSQGGMGIGVNNNLANSKRKLLPKGIRSNRANRK